MGRVLPDWITSEKPKVVKRSNLDCASGKTILIEAYDDGDVVLYCEDRFLAQIKGSDLINAIGDLYQQKVHKAAKSVQDEAEKKHIVNEWMLKSIKRDDHASESKDDKVRNGVPRRVRKFGNRWLVDFLVGDAVVSYAYPTRDLARKAKVTDMVGDQSGRIA